MIPCLTKLAFMEGLGGMEVFLIFVVVLVLFGKDKLPEFARGAGKMMREFKKAASGVEDEFKRALEEDVEKKKIAPPAAPVARTESWPPASPSLETPPAPPPAAATPTPPPAPPPRMLPSDGDGTNPPA